MTMVFEDRRNFPREVDCPPRRARVPVRDVPGVAYRPNVANLIDATGRFYLKARDILDFGLLFDDWLAYSGNTILKTVTWVAAPDSPQAPTIVTTQFFPSGEAFAIIGPGTVGDVYWLDCTVTTEVVQPKNGEVIPVASRTLVRRIAITVISG